MTADRWRFWIDRGGTFTDLVGLSPGGEFVVRKVLSRTPSDPVRDPAVDAIREVLGVAPGDPLPEEAIEEVRLGTTVATNALLERQVAPVLLLVDPGLADLSRIGDQHRPDIFALRIERTRPLPVRVIELNGRTAADGTVVRPLRFDAALEAAVRRAAAEGYRSCAVALMHSYRHPDHERAVGAWLEGLGFESVLLSHRVSPLPRLVPRLSTTVAEAALRPGLARYLDQVREALGGGTRLRVMTSSGALQSSDRLLAKDTILSGPAGGMVGAVAVARAAGFADRPILGFDMGGTSTDVFHWQAAGDAGPIVWERASESDIDGMRLQAPMLPIHTVAAGGGSVLHIDGGRLQVGPRSAGAEPGPACYGRGGPLTVTDANLLLGRIPAGALPSLFGAAGDEPPDHRVVERRFDRLAADLGLTGREAVAQGALEIAIERMAEAIRRISIQRGHDLRQAVLVCFGSAAGQHACPLADSLGIDRVLLHPLAGVLSAYGIGLACQSVLRERSLRLPLDGALGSVSDALEELGVEAERALRETGDLAASEQPARLRRLELRYHGSDRGLLVDWPAAAASAEIPGRLRTDFEARHRRRFGYVVEGEPLVVERVQVELIPAGLEAGIASRQGVAVGPEGARQPQRSVPVWLTGPAPGWRSVPLRRREDLVPGQRLEGPVLLVEATGTTVVEPHWSGRLLPGGELLLERERAVPAGPAAGTAPLPAMEAVDPVRLELYNHRFSAIAEQMGERLRQSSRSVNIRERLDFSCALFDGCGRLVANAPHIPVHLGSMGASVAALRAAVAAGERPPLRPGDAYASNDPFHGGTHLPDITVITPVFAPTADGEDGPRQADPMFFVACRGHHADVGGITPGSMPPFSHRIEEEGVLLDNVPLLRDGRFDFPAWRGRLAAGPHPVRRPERLLADLQAQLAANRLGVEELVRLIDRQGGSEVIAYMGHVQANAAESVRCVIDRLEDGEHEVFLDDGSRIRVTARVERRARRILLDFTGTSEQQSGNFNAPLSITRAAVIYVFRCLVGQPIPLNDGCFEPIDLVVPPGCLLRPAPPAAVVAGNVETSQAVANALFGALGVMAAAQGTMNNLSFGDETRQYYETICGGTGAGLGLDGRGFDGAAAVQSHMTNSRLTDPEILEDRFPVRLERFMIRRGSGGSGRWKGGDGVVRALRFLEPMSVSLLSGSRRVAPFALAGGEPGLVGRNRIEWADGGLESVPGCTQVEVGPGDGVVIETPGGGGYGVVVQEPVEEPG